MTSKKHLFSRALAAGAGKLHLAAHSHHLWPDVTYEAHLQAWQDAATNWDAKWTKVMDEVIPEAQSHIARHLNLADPASIVFAPNTHEFVVRLFSTLPTPARILTTDSEFHSFARQAERLAEDGLITLDIVPTEPFDNFPQRFAAAATHGHDMVFFCHVFFNSSYAITDISALIDVIPNPETLVVIDGYHGFMARPTDLSGVQHRAFYMAGGYKYAMSGEGACFLACPPGYAPRPRNTGWYAAFGALANPAGGVPYPESGARFFGASFDPSGLYRLNAVMRMLQDENVQVAAIHAHAQHLQEDFVAALEKSQLPGLTQSDLIVSSTPRGNFLAYRSTHAPSHQAKLAAAGIVTDVRGNTIRFGFGPYHDAGEGPALAERVATAIMSRTP
jgi:selenocysteine lyase/cysteine desulfurase